VNRFIALIARHGIPLVALNVFLEQIGAPVPAVPSLLVAGGLSREGRMSSTHLMIAAVAASLVADWIWFLMGRWQGYRILRLLCRISLSPDSCVRQTETNFERWGMKSLMIAKFVPGFSTVAPPLAGATRRGTIEFLIYDAGGSILWAGSAVVTGRLFHRAISAILLRLENLGWWAVVFVASALLLLILSKWWQRMRFLKQLRVARLSPADLKAMFDRGESPVVVDARSATARKLDPRRIPTSFSGNIDELGGQLAYLPPHADIVLYCT
jgi:membrane protein DedA with SNARE-associated domain